MGSCPYPPATFKKRVTVHNPTRSSDGQGGDIETWIPVATVWASLDPVKGYERFQAMQMQTVVTHKLVMRYHPAVSTDSRFVLGDRVFAAKEVLNRGEASRFLDVRTAELVTVPYLSNAPGAVRLEGGGYLLLEDGSRMLLETAV